SQVGVDSSIDDAFEPLLRGEQAVLVVEAGKPVAVITRADLLEFVAHRGKRAKRTAAGASPPAPFTSARDRIPLPARSCSPSTSPPPSPRRASASIAASSTRAAATQLGRRWRNAWPRSRRRATALHSHRGSAP